MFSACKVRVWFAGRQIWIYTNVGENGQSCNTWATSPNNKLFLPTYLYKSHLRLQYIDTILIKDLIFFQPISMIK